MPESEVRLKLDEALLAKARVLGPLDAVVDRALRQALDPAEATRRRRWAEDNALLLEALAGGAEELKP